MIRKWMYVCLLVLASIPATADEVVPISPCRVLDTRNTGAGYVSAGTQINLKVRASYDSFGAIVHPGSGQGGASGCSIPTMATAVLLNLVAVSPSATGHVTLWPYGTTQPSTASLNITAAETGGTGLFGLLGTGSYDLGLKGAFLSAYYVADITGYTMPSALVGQAVGTQFGHLLVVELASGVAVKAYAPSVLVDFKDSWEDVIGDAVDNCVRVEGRWVDGNSVGEAGIFEARSLPIVMPGYCGPNL